MLCIESTAILNISKMFRSKTIDGSYIRRKHIPSIRCNFPFEYITVQSQMGNTPSTFLQPFLSKCLDMAL